MNRNNNNGIATGPHNDEDRGGAGSNSSSSYHTAAAAAMISPAVEETPKKKASASTSTAILKDYSLDCNFEVLFRLLGSDDDVTVSSVSECLQNLGCSCLDDMAFFEESDFETANKTKDSKSLSLTYRRKLACIAEYLRLGGDTIGHFSSMKELMGTVRQMKEEAAAEQPPPAVATEKNKDDDYPVVHLDVGGHKFTTLRKTMCRVPGSVLEAMFSGRHEKAAVQTQDGTYILDRNGEQFGYILDFLRVGGVVSLPKSKEDRHALALEADYYGLDPLVRAIKMPGVDMDEHLTEEILCMREEEVSIRATFQSNDAVAGHNNNMDPFQGLIPLFCPEDGVDPLPVQYEPLPETISLPRVMDIRKTEKQETAIYSTVATLDNFTTNFNRVHANVLHRIRDVLVEENIVIAGGSVLQGLTSSATVRTAQWWGKKSDVDLFVTTRDREEANRIARRIFYALAIDNERWVVLRGRGVINIHRINEQDRTADQTVQIVLRLYDSPAEVLYGFDCDCCGCAYDGKMVWVSPRCLHALRRGVNVLNPLHAWPNRASYEIRCSKYSFRGFAVVVPGLDKDRIDLQRIRGTKLVKLKGLARLLKIAAVAETTVLDDDEEGPLERAGGHYIERLMKSLKSDEELLPQGRSDMYDDIGEVIVPSCFCQGNPEAYHWYEYASETDDFPLASECRDRAWQEIEDSSELDTGELPALLLNAWDDKKRSREYLNATVDKYDLDNIYYDGAYCCEQNDKGCGI